MKKGLYLASGLWMIIAMACIFVGDWQIKEDQYVLKFETKKASGTIGGLKGKIQFDQNDPTQSSFDVTVEVSTLNTGNNLKNQHAKAGDFLNAEQYPTIRFVSGKIEKRDQGYLVTGKLTIKEITKEITVPFTFREVGMDAIFEGKMEINTEDYNLKKNGVGGAMIIELNVPVKKS